MKSAVIIFPGSNCDDDMVHALKQFTGAKVEKVWHKKTSLEGFDLVVLPGGFSYGDYLRSGAIARFSPIMQAVIAHAEAGKLLLGVCNGFQILCEAGLLPGALLHNDNSKFICKNVFIKPENTSTMLTKSLDQATALKIPIAHGEGRFFAPPEQLLAMEKSNQVIFRYCDENGNITKEANPNGSINNIAGVCNEQKNVFGLMPHPERAVFETLANEDGRPIFQSIFEKEIAL
ncbi:MAG: Phosphoribosylformylglycinamidine synthase 1 [Bacteroidota bacterium]